MFLPFSACVLFVTILCIFLAWRWSRRSLEKLAEQIPGPRPWPFIGNALELGTNTVDLYKAIYRLMTDYSPLCRIWMGPKLFLLMRDPKDMEIVLSNIKYNDKAMVYDFLHPWLGTGLLTSTGEKWQKHRKFITPTFHFKILEQFLISFNNKADILIKRLQKEVGGSTFDIYKYMTLYTLDTITDTAMGLNVNAQADETSHYVAAVKKVGEIIMTRMMKPWLYPNPVFSMTPYAKSQKEALVMLHDTTDKMIQKKKREKENCNENSNSTNHDMDVGLKKRVAFLDLLLQKNGEGVSFSDENLREEVDTFMFEGHDTTSSSLSFTLWLLSTHPDIQERVYEEVKKYLSNSEKPTIQILNEMKYLECVIKESLRLYPSVPLLGREIHEDTKISRNIILPANTSIIIPTYMVHRNPEYFTDPETFNPDRFLPDRVTGQHPFSYIPFSAGSRNCIGQKFALLEMKLAIAEIIMHFKLHPDKDFQPILSAELIVKSLNGIKLQITSRKSLLQATSQE